MKSAPLSNFTRPCVWAIALGVIVWAWGAEAAELGSTKVTAVRNLVTHKGVTESKEADVGQLVVQGESVQTKEQSLAELTADDASVIRLGAFSVFSYNSKERIVKLDKGTMLMHTPPGNGGATIESGGVTGAISGTTFMLTASPAKCSDCKQELQVNEAGKVLCRDHPNNPPSSGGFALIVLEGSSVTKVTGADGATVDVAPGQMAVVGPKGSGAPRVYAVNITQIARTSPLINAFPNPLPSMPQIIATAYQLQGQNLNTTGTSAVAISSGGQLLTAASPPPNPFVQTFVMASSQPGQNNTTSTGNLANIATAAGGGGGGPVTPTGVAPTGGLVGLPTLPGSINTANTSGQQGVAGNPTPISATATVTTKVYDGTTDADLTGASLTGSATSASLANDTTGTFASKNVGTGISVSTGMTLTGSGASLFRFTAPTLTGTILAKDLQVFNATAAGKVYDGTTAAMVTGSPQLLDKAIGTGTPTDGLYFTGENVGLINTATGNFANPNAGTWSVLTAMALAGADIGNYTLSQPSLSATITARPIQLLSPLVSAIEYNGSTSFSATRLLGAADLNNIVGSEQLNVTGNGTITGTADVGIGKFASMTYVLGNGANGGLAGNYLPLVDDSILIDITQKTLSYANPSAAPKVYDGTVNATVTLGGVVGRVGNETLTITPSSSFGDKNVGTGKGVTVSFVLADGSNGGKASNYRLNNLTLSADITAKPVDVDLTAAVISKAYNGTASVTVTGAALGQIAVGAGTTTDGLAYTGDNVALAANPAVTLQRSLPGTLIPVIGTGFSLTGTDAGNYSLRQPTGLTGTITGTATLDQNGAALNVSANSFLHVRDTTARRLQNGMTFQTSVGEVLIENSSFDGWMKRSSTPLVIPGGSAGETVSFTETAAVPVDSPVLKVRLEPNSPSSMVLGDYRLVLQHDPDNSTATALLNGDERSATLFDSPGLAANGLGSFAPSADLILRDTAAGELQNLTDTPSYTSLDANGEAVNSGSTAPVRGEFQPDGTTETADLNTSTAAGTWNLTLDQPVLSGEAKVTDVRLKYNNNTKVLIEGPDGVRLLNVKFEGMDEVDVRTTPVNNVIHNRVLMSATLLTDPDITKMVVKASQTLEAVINSDATFQEVKSLSNADLLAGVVRDGTGFKFVSGADRTLTIDGPGAAAATPNININGQLAIAAHTVVFNNANISSGGVIDVRTRDGMVNRTYGTVVPGTTSFTGGNGNYFLNRGNGISMTIGSSADISANLGTKLTDVNNNPGAGTVMSVGKVQ